MKRITLARLRLTVIVLSVLVALFTVDLTAFAQAANPTPTRPPSGSNPAKLAPTDVPVDWSLLWVLIFFVVLLAGLLFSNWLVRRGTFNEPEKQV
jgi:hypothetical protein